jgi:hypothetical protein
MPAHLVNGARAGILVGRYLGQLKPCGEMGCCPGFGGRVYCTRLARARAHTDQPNTRIGELDQ